MSKTATKADDKTAPHECPHDEDYHHWEFDGQFFVRGHKITVTCDCGEPMEYDSMYGENNGTAVWQCSCGLDFSTAPAAGDPGNWRSWADSGCELIFNVAFDDEYCFVLRNQDDSNQVFRIEAPTMPMDQLTDSR